MPKFLFKVSGFLLVLFVFTFVVDAPAHADDYKAKNGPKVITAETLKKMMEDGAEFLLIDARRKKDYDDKHIAGAINLSAIDTNAKTLAEVAPEMDTKLVFYCQNAKCQASPIAASKALGAGYKYVYEFKNGLDEWVELGYPAVSR